MKEFSCGDVVPGCSASFCAESDDDLLGQVARHASTDHGLQEIRPELVEAVKKHIRCTNRG
jgi:predicted small metal-binding protein